MIRYVKQRDHYTCGPIAVINICKWAGYKVTLKEIKKFKKLTNCIDGTYSEDLEKALKKLGKKYFQLGAKLEDKEVTIRKIERHCKKKGIVLLNYQWPDSTSFHYILVIKLTKHRVRVVNYFPEGAASRLIYRTTFKKLIKNREHVIAWLINENSRQKKTQGNQISLKDI